MIPDDSTNGGYDDGHGDGDNDAIALSSDGEGDGDDDEVDDTMDQLKFVCKRKKRRL